MRGSPNIAATSRNVPPSMPLEDTVGEPQTGATLHFSGCLLSRNRVACVLSQPTRSLRPISAKFRGSLRRGTGDSRKGRSGGVPQQYLWTPCINDGSRTESLTHALNRVSWPQMVATNAACTSPAVCDGAWRRHWSTTQATNTRAIWVACASTRGD